MLTSGGRLRGLVRMADDFNFAAGAGTIIDGAQGAVRIAPGARDVVIDVVIEGPPYAWWQARASQPYVYPFNAIGMAGDVRKVVVKETTVRSFPAGSAVSARDYDGLVVTDLRVEQCQQGVGLRWPMLTGNKNTKIDGVFGRDLAAVENRGMGPSLLYPGQHTGNNLVYGEGCENLLVRNVLHVGEGKGIKFWRGVNHVFDNVTTQQLWLGGDIDVPAGYKGPMTASNYLVTRSLLGGSVYGMGAGHTADAIPLFTRGAIAQPIAVEHTRIVGPRPGVTQGRHDWRYEFVAAQLDCRVKLAESCRLIDLRGDLPDPSAGRGWFAVETGGAVEDGSSHERYSPQWAG